MLCSKQCKVKTTIALSLGLLYATTFSIQYWTMRQGSLVGEQLYYLLFYSSNSLCLLSKVEPIRLALSMALIFSGSRTQCFDASDDVSSFYLYTFVKSPIAKKKETFVQVLIAVILFLLLTVNVWLVLLYLRGTNHLLDPFINREIGKNGIDGTARYWLYTPISLMVLLILQFIYAVLNWKKFAKWKKYCILFILSFLLIDRSFPWRYLVENGNTFAELIQFPFRFFVPATILTFSNYRVNGHAIL